MSPFDKSQLGFVIELKAIDKDGDVDQALDRALEQIDAKQYTAGLEADGVARVARLGIVLQGKAVRVRVATEAQGTES